MSDCKVKISVDICGESALDKVSLLIAEQDKIGDMSPKLSIRDICKQVAKEFNAANEGAHVKWETLRKAYQRAQKVDTKVGTCTNNSTKKLVHVPTLEKELVPLDVPMADTTKYITIEEYNKALARIKELETILEMQSKVIDECMIQEQKTMDIVPTPEVEKGAIKRAKAFTFVKKFGSDLQVLAITNQNPDNKRLYNLFDKVRLDYLQHSPPTSLESDILDATHII